MIFDLSKTGLVAVLLKGSAILPLDVCMIFNQNASFGSLPIEPNCNSRQKIGKKFESYLDFRTIKNQLGVYNGNNQSVPVTLNL